VAKIVQPWEPKLAGLLQPIQFGSAITVTFGFAPGTGTGRDQRNFPGYGFVVPKREQRASLAATFASRKWANRAPEGADLVRVFLGGPQSPTLEASDKELIHVARSELIKLTRVIEDPCFEKVLRYPNAMPLYHVGHQERVEDIEQQLRNHPWLKIAGNSLYGVGIPDAIGAGERAAEAAFPTTSQGTSPSLS
jgi:protoporphyrinogen/coproporphyrinogen III oxidase